MDLTHWASIYHVHELNLVKLFHNTAHDIAPSVISSKAVWHNSLHNLRGHKNAVLQFSTYLFKKLYLIYRRATVLVTELSGYSHKLNMFNLFKPMQ